MAGVGRLRIAAASILVVAAVLAGWASAPSGSGLSRLFEAATQPRGAVTARPPRLIVIIEENHSFEEIIGSPAAPFLNRLAAHGTLLTHSYAVTHPSLPNYAALLSGRTPIRSDCRACTFAGPTLVDQLEARHISWAAYFQGLPQPCSMVAGAGAYTEAVDPFMHAARIRDQPSRCDRVLPFSRFPADLAGGRLPTVVFVIRIFTTRCTPAGSGSPTPGCGAWSASCARAWSGGRTPAWSSPSTRAGAATCGPAATAWAGAAPSPPSWPDHGSPGGRDPVPYTHPGGGRPPRDTQ